MADVAARLGVSKSTVSLALRNHSSIPPARREQVRRVAREMGFVPDPFLSGLAAYRRAQAPPDIHGVLAWITHWKQPEQIRQRFGEFAAYWRGAEAAARNNGFRLDDVRWDEGCTAKRFERILLSRGIQGVLIPPHHSSIDWADFDWNQFSVVRFGTSVKSPDSNLVTSDQLRAVAMAIENIFQRGYRRIGMVVGRRFNEHLGGNYASGFLYMQSWLRLKPTVPLMLLDDAPSSPEDQLKVRESLRAWMEKYKPDAVLTTQMEIPALIRELGYRIPQDVALAGTTMLDIPGVNAGVDQHSEAIGRIAAETLIKQLNINERGEPADPCRILVESRWKDGSTLPWKRTEKS